MSTVQYTSPCTGALGHRSMGTCGIKGALSLRSVHIQVLALGTEHWSTRVPGGNGNGLGHATCNNNLGLGVKKGLNCQAMFLTVPGCDENHLSSVIIAAGIIVFNILIILIPDSICSSEQSENIHNSSTHPVEDHHHHILPLQLGDEEHGHVGEEQLCVREEYS